MSRSLEWPVVSAWLLGVPVGGPCYWCRGPGFACGRNSWNKSNARQNVTDCVVGCCNLCKKGSSVLGTGVTSPKPALFGLPKKRGRLSLRPLVFLNPLISRRPAKPGAVRRMLRKVRESRQKQTWRICCWDIFVSCKPSAGKVWKALVSL